MWHPGWRPFFPLEQTRAALVERKLLFCRAKAFIRNMPQIGWQLPGLLSKNKEMKKCAWSGCLQWIYTSRPKKGKSPQQPDKFYTWNNWKGCIWIFIFIESYYVFFSIWPQKVQNHSTYDNTFKRRQIWMLPRTFTHNVFYKGVQHVKLPADSQKSFAYTTADSTGKARQKLWKLMFVLI